jgi:hypothetical protein
VALGTVIIGLAGAWHYAQLDLTLSHYDARGHLIVARRVFDNLTPGWIQFGAVWLPLPHVLNAIPVQWDWAYRTGATGVFWSIVVMAWGMALVARLVARHLDSPLAGAAVAAAVGLNASTLYLLSTPMTEPLLFGLAGVALYAVDRFVWTPSPVTARHAGWALAALVMTRYEGWCIGGVLGGLALIARPRQIAPVALWPVGAIAVFLLHSYGSTGRWFTTGGFFEANNPALGDPVLAWSQIVEAARTLTDPWVLTAGWVGALSLVVVALRAHSEGRAAVIGHLLPLALFAAVALPLYAFTSGHPVRVRYMLSLVVAATVVASWTLWWVPVRFRGAVAVVGLGAVLLASPPMNPKAPMVQEAQWELPHSRARESVTALLAKEWDGTPIMASMGSLGHYMQQMAHAGFDLEDFLHEGNGQLWKAAVLDPAPYVRWMLIEETAEGGDMLAQRARANDRYLARFERLADGGGVVLYRRRPIP